MTKEEFKKFVETECTNRGFVKKRNCFYLTGHEILCKVYLQKSNYAETFYVNYCFFVGNYTGCGQFPNQDEADLTGRFEAMSKKETYNGKCFLTSMIEYEEYCCEELRKYFSVEFDKKILPPIIEGKRYIRENIGTLYSLTLNKDCVLEKLTI